MSTAVPQIPNAQALATTSSGTLAREWFVFLSALLAVVRDHEVRIAAAEAVASDQERRLAALEAK